MRLMLLLTLGIIASGCLPPRPQVDFCVVDYEFDGLHCSDGHGKHYDLFLKDSDKFVCSSPRDSELLTNYVIELERALLKAQKKK